MVGIKPPSPQQIWRFSSAHLRKVISKTKWSVIQYMKEILEVLDHRERAESIVSWSGLHLKYNAIFFYARAGESASCQFFAASSERSATFFTPRVQWKLWKVHLNYPIDTCGGNSCTTSDRHVRCRQYGLFLSVAVSSRKELSELFWWDAEATEVRSTGFTRYRRGDSVCTGNLVWWCRRKTTSVWDLCKAIYGTI